MRAIGLCIVLLAVPAAADPAKPDAKPSLPDIVKEAQKETILFRPKGILGMTGAVVSGVVVDPGPHADDKMAVTPPDPNDPMALEIGTNHLLSRIPRTPWLPRDLSLDIKRGADQLWDVVIPKL